MYKAYVRISLDTQASGSISKQRDRLSAYVRLAGGDPSQVEWFADESVSGSKVAMRDRVAGGRLWRGVSPGDVVLVTKVDRAARNVRDLLEVVEHVTDQGGSIVFVDNNLDTSGHTGRFILVMLAAIAELEAAIIAERRRESLESFRREGRHAVGKAPFGFMSTPRQDGRGLMIRPDPATAPRLLEAIERVMQGEPQDTVRLSLGMSKTGFHKLLRNPRLAGMTPEGTYETVRDQAMGTSTTKLVDSGVVTVDGVPRVDPDAGILTLAEWRELQDFLGAPSKSWSRQNGYGAALTCGVCGDRMYKNVAKRRNLKTGQGHDTYVCRRVRHAPGEGAPSVMVHRADAYLEEQFLSMFGRRRVLAERRFAAADARTEAVSLAQIALSEAQRRFAAALTAEEESEALDAQLAAKRSLRDAESLPVEVVTTVEETGMTVAEVWRDADNAHRCQLLTRHGVWRLLPGRAAIQDRIVYAPDELLNELITHVPGSQSLTHDDEGTYLM